jgi:Tfp pilus assembly protein PilF
MLLTALAALAVAKPSLAQVGAQGNVFVELSRPQCDDQGHYMSVLQPREVSLTGFVGCQSDVTAVMVNDVSAALFPANYQLFGNAGFARAGFRALVFLNPDEPLTIGVTDANGNVDTVVYQPDRAATTARLSQMYAASDQDPYVCLRMANMYAWEGDYDDAWPLYHRCISLQVDFVFGPYFFGLALCDADRWDDAILEFGLCEVLAPGFDVVHYNVGRWHERHGNHDAAIREFREVTSTRPNFVEAHLRMGESLAHANRWDEAAEEFHKTLGYDPKLGIGHQGLANVLEHQGRHDEATAELAQAHKPARIGTGHYSAGASMAATTGEATVRSFSHGNTTGTTAGAAGHYSFSPSAAATTGGTTVHYPSGGDTTGTAVGAAGRHSSGASTAGTTGGTTGYHSSRGNVTGATSSAAGHYSSSPGTAGAAGGTTGYSSSHGNTTGATGGTPGYGSSGGSSHGATGGTSGSYRSGGGSSGGSSSGGSGASPSWGGGHKSRNNGH